MYFDSGHVTDMQDSKIVEENHYCVRSLVLSSYRKDQYNVFVMLHEVTGKVLDARCHCEVSAMGRCSHVSALLYAILDYKTMFEKENIPCTSKLCTWNTGRKRKMPLKAVDRQYTCTKKTSAKPLVQFNPCPLEKRPTEQERVDSVNELLSHLRYKAAQSSTSQPSAWEVLLETRYDDYALDNERIIIFAWSV